jgi:FkbM family methyltransferase
MRAIRFARGFVRSLGYDIVRFPRESHRDHLHAVLSGLAINCVLDVGGHHGAFAGLVREAGFRGFIASFEPVSDSFEVLATESRKDPSWEVHQVALGSRSATIDLNVTRDERFSSFRRPSTYARRSFPESAVGRQENVDVRRLDEVFPEVVPVRNPRVFLKIDTQGWDLEVLEGATDCLGVIQAVQSEMAVKAVYEGAPTYLEAIPRLNELGFELSGIYPVVRDAQLRIVELDCVFIRTEDVN